MDYFESRDRANSAASDSCDKTVHQTIKDRVFSQRFPDGFFEFHSFEQKNKVYNQYSEKETSLSERESEKVL